MPRLFGIVIARLKLYKNARKGTRPGRLFRPKVSPRSPSPSFTSPISSGREIYANRAKANSAHPRQSLPYTAARRESVTLARGSGGPCGHFPSSRRSSHLFLKWRIRPVRFSSSACCQPKKIRLSLFPGRPADINPAHHLRSQINAVSKRHFACR